jgi:cytochrome c oxidase subunit 1
VGWAESPVVTGLSTDHRSALATTVLDAAPEHHYSFPPDSIWPLALALVTGGSLTGLIFHPWAAPIGAVLATVVLICWFWQGSHSPAVPEEAHTEPGPKASPTHRAQEMPA